MCLPLTISSKSYSLSERCSSMVLLPSQSDWKTTQLHKNIIIAVPVKKTCVFKIVALYFNNCRWSWQRIKVMAQSLSPCMIRWEATTNCDSPCAPLCLWHPKHKLFSSCWYILQLHCSWVLTHYTHHGQNIHLWRTHSTQWHMDTENTVLR